MKKLFLLGFLILSVACQGTASTLTPDSASTLTVQAPPEPATATETLTPAPTASATLSPTHVPLYFTEEFNTDLSAWTFFQTGGEIGPSTTLENDMLRVDISSPHTWYSGIHNSNTYKDVSISAKFTGAPSGSMGLICRYSESGWYEFNIGSDGTYSVLAGQWLSEGVGQYIPIATNTSEYLQPGNMNYEIKLTCQENTLLLFVNEKLFRKLDVAHYGLTEGRIGITASSFEETPMTAIFDWVKANDASQ
jgi:hypothetical protein